MGSSASASKELASAEMELRAPILTLFLLSSALTVPYPFASRGGGKSCNLVRSPTKTSAECFSEPECENKCSTSYEQQCSTRNQQQCSTVNEQQCSTVSEQQCSTRMEEECSTTTEQQCSTTNEQQCSTTNEQQCSTVNERS